MKLKAHVFCSPVGDVFAAVDEEGALVHFHFLGQRKAADSEQKLKASGCSITWSADALREVAKQVAEYFAHQRKSFDLPLHFAGTKFQLRVWNELLKIRYGQITSYSELARRVESPQASRAVGRANGSNPISLVVPCHRVIGADRSLTGYGGGLDIKKALLTLEGALSADSQITIPF